ncbi:hypothetical protein [Halorientalis litorea]|uniref:hypothetical protein n=1 Tax=Halorientalis litorea TaxID=2931977 RepID=UPI001FF57BB0|nr:hypothetical protein [Halorientalis litorea]
MTDSTYRLEIKPSARRVCRRVGEWVNRDGTRRRFDSKALARQWARDCRGPGATVWVQDAAPADERPVDGYLVGGARRGRTRDHSTPEQASLGRF